MFVLALLFTLATALQAQSTIDKSVTCRGRNLCCNGRDSSCAISLYSSDGSFSPLGNIIAAAGDSSTKECYCDSACIVLGDCCPDYKEHCGVVDCRVSEWQPWSECNVTCGLGHMSRSRRVLTAARNGGQECSDLHQQRACNGQKCETKDGDKVIRESAIILQSSFSTHRNVDHDRDIRRNLRLNYPKDPLRENVDEYCALFKVTKSLKACETLGPEVAAKLVENQNVCVQCQEAAMRKHLGYRCFGHGSVGRSTRWTTMARSTCHGRWIRQTQAEASAAGCLCGSSAPRQAPAKNSTIPAASFVPDFIFI